MDELLKPVKTTKKIHSNIAKFESLALHERDHAGNINNTKVSKPRRVIIDLDKDNNDEDLTKVNEFEDQLRPRQRSILKPNSIATLHGAGQRSKRDSTAFLQRSYLLKDEKRKVQSEPRPQATTTTPALIIPGTSLVEDAREILRSQPSQEDLVAVLEYLQCGTERYHDFNVKIASPQSAQIINVLVTTTVPDIWTNLTTQKELSTDEARIKKMIVKCLASTAGIGALLAQIKQISSSPSMRTGQDSEIGNSNSNSSTLSTQRMRLVDSLHVLAEVLKSDKTMLMFLHDTANLYTLESQRRMSWQELVTAVAGGRILGLAAQVLATIDDRSISDQIREQISWLGDGKLYSRWLARNISTATMRLQPTDNESWKYLGLLLKRGLTLGHRDTLVEGIYTPLLLGKKTLWTSLHRLLTNLSDYEQKLIFDSILVDIGSKYFGATISGYQNDAATKKAVSATAALIAGLVKSNGVLERHLEEWLVVANASYAAIGLASRRALIATLATSEDKLERILERALSNFADKLQIQHASSLHQDAYAQTILLAIGYLKRSRVAILKQHSISSLTTRSVSNRLGASIPHTRFLGMVIGVAMSKAVDMPDKVLNFGIEEMESEEAQLWLSISELQDTVAPEIDISVSTAPHTVTSSRSDKQKARHHHSKISPKPKIIPTTSKIIAIEEIAGETTSEDEDDLIPYAKPDSDPEDSDDDPTLINRSKPSAPVYIVDLIKQLQTNGQPDVIELALKTAPSLIRRKIGFGNELSDNIHALTTTLINLQEGVRGQDLENLQLQSIITCVVAKPDAIAPSLATLYFEGDFSISQRVMLLTALGLSARELAGFSNEDNNNASTLATKESFPSKRLPPHLVPSKPKQLEAQRQDPIQALTLAQAQSTIRPMALAAADQMTGPAVLKIRTFSSRMEVEKKKDERLQARTKKIPQNLHMLLVKSFYLPLCSRMSLIHSSGTVAAGRLRTSISLPSLVRMLLQTLTLIMHTLGPLASLHLPVLTNETLLLLLSLHAIPQLGTDAAVLPALLHLLLSLMDVTIEAGTTAQERLIVEHGKDVAELVNWANSLGDKISVPITGDDDSSMPWTVLAAGIQVKWFELGRRFQGRMLGLSMDEESF